jgi:mannitol/fructose-specific phosphotransferase system IIA component
LINQEDDHGFDRLDRRIRCPGPLKAGGKEEAIRELVDVLVAAGKITDARTALQAVLDREAKGHRAG